MTTLRNILVVLTLLAAVFQSIQVVGQSPEQLDSLYYEVLKIESKQDKREEEWEVPIIKDPTQETNQYQRGRKYPDIFPIRVHTNTLLLEEDDQYKI